VAAIVYAVNGAPVQNWIVCLLWLALLALLSFLMVSTWRYQSFKDVQLLRPRSPLTVITFGSLIYLLWTYTSPMLLAIATAYVSSGIVVRIGGIVRRRLRQGAPQPER
jgi:CDP-diacylglycerol--serine O-phosphatidyltransferase